ncbi:MAG: CGGC domain-containing protein [Desulfovibrionales bacterium]
MCRIGLIRCEKNEEKCPLTSCLKSLRAGVEGFSIHREACELVGVFTCRCPGDSISRQAAILKAKGADVIHLCTCVFAGKKDTTWTEGLGFCPEWQNLGQKIAQTSGLPCVAGSAHLPPGYEPLVMYPDAKKE